MASSGGEKGLLVLLLPREMQEAESCVCLAGDGVP